jgi:hypothetical protein
LSVGSMERIAQPRHGSGSGKEKWSGSGPTNILWPITVQFPNGWCSTGF